MLLYTQPILHGPQSIVTKWLLCRSRAGIVAKHNPCCSYELHTTTLFPAPVWGLIGKDVLDGDSVRLRAVSHMHTTCVPGHFLCVV